MMLDDQSYAGRAITPEQRLMLAILEDALDILLKPTAFERRPGTLRAETEQWLFSNDTAWPFAFLNVCHALGLEPASVRRRVLEDSAGPYDVRPAA